MRVSKTDDAAAATVRLDICTLTSQIRDVPLLIDPADVSSNVTRSDDDDEDDNESVVNDVLIGHGVPESDLLLSTRIDVHE